MRKWNFSESSTLWKISSSIFIDSEINLPTRCIGMSLCLKHLNTLFSTHDILLLQRWLTLRCLRLNFMVFKTLVLIIIIIISILHLTYRIYMFRIKRTFFLSNFIRWNFRNCKILLEWILVLLKEVWSSVHCLF